MLLYEKFKSNIKNKRRHIVRIKMSIVRTTEGKSTTMIDMFLNNSEDKRIYGMVGKDFIQKDGKATTVSYSLLSTRKKAEPRYVKDADLDQINRVSSQIDMNQALMSQAYEAFYSRDLTRYQQIIDSMGSALQNAVPPVNPAPVEQNIETITEAAPAPGPRLLEVWSDYIKDKGQKWRKQTANENQRFFDVLYHVVGDMLHLGFDSS